jgi:hypothetical protein
MLRRALVAIVLFEIAFIAAAGTGAWQPHCPPFTAK